MDISELTEEEIKKLIDKFRLYVNDKAGNKFTDEEIIELIKSNCCLYRAVGEGWLLLSLQVNIEGTKAYTVGNERYDKQDPSNVIKIAQRNAEYFNNKCNCDNDDLSGYVGQSFMIGSTTKVDY